MTHMSHFYPQGANLYFIFEAKMNDLDEYLEYQRGIMDNIQKYGAAMSHHPGIGKMTAPWLEAQIGKNQMDIYRALKNHFDPDNLMNPGGTLGIDLPEDQRPETLIGLCRDLVDALPQVTRVYACITYGSKSIPVVTLTALTCAEATHTELEVGGVYYGEVKRENGQVLSARLYDMAALYQLAGLVGTMRASKTAEQVFHQLIWMNEHRED